MLGTIQPALADIGLGRSALGEMKRLSEVIQAEAGGIGEVGYQFPPRAAKRASYGGLADSYDISVMQDLTGSKGPAFVYNLYAQT